MNCSMLSAISLILFLTCFISPASVFAASPSDNNISKCPSDDIAEARKRFSTEQADILLAGGRIIRKGLRLELRVHDRHVVLKDDCTNGESYVRYSFESYFKDIGYYLVSAAGWEGSGFLLINDRSGKKIDLEGAPVVSPDRKRFVVMSMDLEAGYNNNSIQIWRIDSTGPNLEYEAFSDNWGPSDPVWRGNRTIEFKKNILIEPGPKYQSSRVLLIKKDNTWTIKSLH